MARKWLFFFLVMALVAVLLVVAVMPSSSVLSPTPLPLLIEMGPEVVLHTPEESKSVSQPTYLVERADMEYYRHKNADVITEYDKRKKEYPKKEPRLHQEPTPEVETDAILLHAVLQEIGADQQSVHDTTVQDTIKQTYASLKEKGGGAGDFKHVRSSILSWNGGALGAKLTSIVDAIENRNSKLYNLGSDNELTVLTRVWTEGNDNVKDQVIKELLDCEQSWGGGIVCPTGVVTRVVSASLIETPEAMPRSRNVLREEMLSKAAALRTEMENKDSEYKSLTEEEQNSYYKERLKEHLHDEYKGVVSKDTVEAEMKEWVDAI